MGIWGLREKVETGFDDATGAEVKRRVLVTDDGKAAGPQAVRDAQELTDRAVMLLGKHAQYGDEKVYVGSMTTAVQVARFQQNQIRQRVFKDLTGQYKKQFGKSPSQDQDHFRAWAMKQVGYGAGEAQNILQSKQPAATGGQADGAWHSPMVLPGQARGLAVQ